MWNRELYRVAFYYIMNLEGRCINLIKDFVYKYLPDAQIFIFGYRTKGGNKQYPDIDIEIKSSTKISFRDVVSTESDLEDSDILHLTDMVNCNAVPHSILKGTINMCLR